MEPSEDNDSTYVFTLKDIQQVKSCGTKHWDGPLPRNGLSRDGDLQIFLIIQGFTDYMASQGVKIPIKFDWSK